MGNPKNILLEICAANFASAQGEGLFKAKCATCHMTHKNSTGPKLSGAKAKWAAGGAKISQNKV